VYVAELPCINKPCKNGGTCVTGADLKSYTCQCVQPFHGTNCEQSKCTLNFEEKTVLAKVGLYLFIGYIARAIKQ